LIALSAGNLAGEESDAERDGIGEVVNGIGNQREAAGQKPADDLPDSQANIDHYGEKDTAVTSGRVHVHVPVAVGMRVTCHTASPADIKPEQALRKQVPAPAGAGPRRK